MPPITNKDTDADQSSSWVDVVKGPCRQSHYRNGSLVPDPKDVLVSETLDVEEVCVSVSILSLTSSPVSVPGYSMVSPDKTMLSPRVITTTSPSPVCTSSRHQSRTADAKNRAVSCLDQDLASTHQTEAPRTNTKRDKQEADYVCQMFLKTVMSQDSSVSVMLKEPQSKKSKKDLFKEIDKAWQKSSDDRINQIKTEQERFAMVTENDNGKDLEGDTVFPNGITAAWYEYPCL